MLKAFAAERIVSSMFVRMDRRSGRGHFANDFAYFGFPSLRNHASVDLAPAILAAFQQAENGGLSSAAGASIQSSLLFALVSVHKASRAADVCFVHFDGFAVRTECINRVALHR